MKFTTTLDILREHQPCTEGWSKLLRRLGSDYPQDKPIEFSTILESNGLDDALWGLRGVMPEQEADRDRLARLFACDCAESVLHIYERDYPNDNRPREAIRVSRAYALGEARDAAWAAASAAAWDAAWAAARAAASDVAWAAARAATSDAAEKNFVRHFCTDASDGGVA